MKTFESIVKGQNIPTPGVPESFKVLIRELQSLGLNVQVLDKDDNEVHLKEVSEEAVSNVPTVDMEDIGVSVFDGEDTLFDDELGQEPEEGEDEDADDLGELE